MASSAKLNFEKKVSRRRDVRRIEGNFKKFDSFFVVLVHFTQKKKPRCPSKEVEKFLQFIYKSFL